MENIEELEGMNTTKAVLLALQQLAEKCETLEELKKALAEIIDKA